MTEAKKDLVPAGPVGAIVEFLEARKGVIQAACMKNLDAGTLINLARAVVSRTPDLAKCTPISILQAVMFSAEYGLRLGSLGHLYLVPFWNSDAKVHEATPIIGYRGLIELVTRDGRVKGVEARLVYREDTFQIQLGTDARIHHVPEWDGPRGDGDCLGAYCVVTMDGGFQVFDYMTVKELDAIEAQSKSKKVWPRYRGQMRVKTIIRRTLKAVPVGLTMAQAQEAEDMAVGAIDVEPILEEVAKTGTQRLKDKLDAGAEPAGKKPPESGGKPAGKAPRKRKTKGAKEATQAAEKAADGPAAEVTGDPGPSDDDNPFD